METTLRSAIAGVVLLACGGLTTSFGQRSHTCTGPLLGTWKLQSFVTEYQDTGQKTALFGEHPQGYLGYGSDCRMYGIVVRGDRKPPVEIVPTDAEKIELFRGMGAYAGTYTVEGDKVSHHVDVSWNEAWTGTTQVRYFRIAGNVLHIRSAPAKDDLDGKLSSSTLVWTKVQ